MCLGTKLSGALPLRKRHKGISFLLGGLVGCKMLLKAEKKSRRDIGKLVGLPLASLFLAIFWGQRPGRQPFDLARAPMAAVALQERGKSRPCRQPSPPMRRPSQFTMFCGVPVSFDLVAPEVNMAQHKPQKCAPAPT
jgi:hypothetical protein